MPSARRLGHDASAARARAPVLGLVALVARRGRTSRRRRSRSSARAPPSLPMPIDGHRDAAAPRSPARAPRHACATIGELARDDAADRRCRAGRAPRCARSGGRFQRRSARGRIVVGAERAGRARATQSSRAAERRRSVESRSIDERAASRAEHRRAASATRTLTATSASRSERVGRELVGEPGCASSSRASAARAGGRVGRALERPADRGARRTRSSAECRAVAAAPRSRDRADRESPRVVSWADAPAPRRRRPDQPRRRRPRRQRGADPRRRTRRPTAAGLRPRRVPRAGRHRLPARGPAAEPGVRGRRPRRRSTSSRRAPARCAAVDRLPRGRPTTSTTRRPCARDGQVLGVYRKHLLPNYAVFDEQRYFEPSTGRRAAVRDRRRARRRLDLRGRVEPERPDRSRRPRRAPSSIVNINASPYYAGRLARARDDARDARRRRVGVPIVYVNLVGGQDELVFDGASMRVRRGRPPRRARRSSSPRTCWSSTSTCAGVPPPALDPRGACGSALPKSWSASRRSGSTHGAAHRGSRRAGARGLRGARARHARLRAQERLHRRPDRPVGRHRLVARRRDRGRRARRRARARRADAVALLERGQRHRRRRARRQPRHPHAAPCRSSRRTPRSIDMLAPSRSPAPTPDVAEENLQARIRGNDPDDASPTSSAGWCSRPATRARWRRATRRSTATWPAASP